MIEPSHILKNWNITGKIEDISHTGYSGSQIFKITAEDSEYILKGYPSKLSIGNIYKTHEILRTAREHNFNLLPNFVRTLNGDSVVREDNTLWDLVTFLSGSHMLNNPQTSILVNLTKEVAHFHLATNQVLIDDEIRHGNPISLRKIQEIFEWWQIIKKADNQKLSDAGVLDVVEEFIEFATLYFEKSMKRFDWDDSFKKLPRCIVHSDITKRNVLFDNDVVSGVIDLESVRYNSRLLDIARLAMEFANGNKESMKIILEAYDSVSALTQHEKENAMLYVGVLNLTVTLWSIKNYISTHFQNYTNHSDFASKIQQGINIYKVL